MQLDEVDINVKHSGLLEVPSGKEVDQLPQSHFQALIDKKGYEKIIRGLTNLEVWNKNKNPKLSQWASNMADKLKKANHKDESYSDQFQQALDEINAKVAAKLGTRAWNATRDSAKKLAKGSGEALKRAGTTAQNAIVAGAAAPIGVKIANTYSKPHKKEQKYSASDVAAIAAALKKNEDLNEDFLFDKIKANLADFAKAESDAYLKAKAIIDKAQKEQLDASNVNSLKHPILSAIKDGVRVSGHIFIAILLGLTFIALYSRHTGSAKQLFKMVIENVSQNIINDALILIGFTAGFRKLQQIFDKERTVSENLRFRKSLLEKKDSDLKKATKTVAGYATKKIRDAKRAKAQSKHEAFLEGIKRLDYFLEFARKKSDNQSHYKKLPESPASKRKKKIIADAERVAGVKPEIDPVVQAKKKAAIQKGLETKAKNRVAKQQALADQYNQPLKRLAKETKETVQKVAKNIGSRAAEAKEVFKGSTAKNKALRQAALKGGLKGAAITAGLGAAAYGVHKYRNRDK